ncbi:gamma-glutamyltranspeptidase [Aspergillus flavus AF70]|nr:gamma-glutamyltranspeptidase [Aspergillus flavus AF70]
MLEMRLFHLYLTETYITLYPGKLDTNHFQSAVPGLATSYPFCLDALLAFSALHLASKETGDNRQWVECALKYQNRSCSAMSRVLAEFSVEYSGPAFICSILIMLCSYAYPCVSKDDQPFDPLGQILEIRRLLAGCAFFFHQLGKMEHPGELAGWLRYKDAEDLEEELPKDGVPGEVRGLEYLHKKYGSLPWSTIMQPAIQTARQGFPVGRDLVRYMNSAVGDGEDFLSKDPTWAIDFAPNGTRLGLGDTITRKRYADTLETIANNGPDAFYTGPIAETMIQALQAANGTMTLEDLRNYTIAIRDTSQIDYRGYRVIGTSAPSSGTVALNILKVLDTYDSFMVPDNVNLSTHRLDEAIRFGYGLRTELGDPYFLEGLDEYQKDMLEQSTIDEIRGKISDLHTQNVSAYDPKGLESLDTPGTSHIAAVDHTGLTISTITTINLLFGSKVMVPETGIIMNNEMDDFSTPGSSNAFGYVPSEANFIRPGKRPLSSITPTIVTHQNGSVFFVAGSAGGSRIITATVQNIIHAVDEGLSAAEALARPRLHDQLIPNQVRFEYAYNNETVAFMKSLGHNVTWVAPGDSTAQAIRVLPNGTFDAAGEPRQLDSGGFAV